MVKVVEARFGDDVEVVHVMDREGDQYDLLADLRRSEHRFVIRLAHDRAVLGEESERLRAVLARVPVLTKRTVEVTKRRSQDPPRSRPPREARTALLSVRATTVILKRSVDASANERTLTVNVVQAVEENPPPGQRPIEWLLVTSEAVDKAEAVLAVLDIYNARWVIEEFFKALKTGCALEKRQLESYFTYVRALALLMPLAWGLLHLRSVSRHKPDALATIVLTRRQIEVLRGYKPGLPRSLTAEAALQAIAKLGGHLKSNGPPGWQVLGRGYEKLLYLEAGWIARERAGAGV
jgi:hypothetical protein